MYMTVFIVPESPIIYTSPLIDVNFCTVRRYYFFCISPFFMILGFRTLYSLDLPFSAPSLRLPPPTPSLRRYGSELLRLTFTRATRFQIFPLLYRIFYSNVRRGTGLRLFWWCFEIWFRHCGRRCQLNAYRRWCPWAFLFCQLGVVPS